MRPRSRLFVPLAVLAAGACVPCVGDTLVLLTNLSGASLTVNQPWMVEGWGQPSASVGFAQQVVESGAQGVFRIPGLAGTVAITCTVHQLEGTARFNLAGLEVRALERSFLPVAAPGEPAPESGRLPPPPGMPTPDAAALPGPSPIPFLDLGEGEAKNP
jgi:hypothetical protein